MVFSIRIFFTDPTTEYSNILLAHTRYCQVANDFYNILH